MPTQKSKQKVARSRHTGRLLPERPAHRPSAQTKALAKVMTSPAVGTDVRSMIKLGSIVTDVATGLKGMLILYQASMDGSRQYVMQPEGLDRETCQPVKPIWLVPTRISGGEIIPEPDLSTQILGTQVEDEATGFSGTAIDVLLFMSGCLHVTVQPKGKLDKTGASVQPHDFDILRLKGKAIKPMTEPQKEEHKKEKPSPMGIERQDRPIPGE